MASAQVVSDTYCSIFTLLHNINVYIFSDLLLTKHIIYSHLKTCAMTLYFRS